MAKKTTQNPEHKWIVGTWYMNPMGYMINYQRGNHAYGFQGGWKNDLRITPKYLEDNEFIEAPREDILDYLRNEAVERGLIKGSVYESILNNEKITIEGDGEYYLTENNKTLSYLTHVAGYTLLIEEKWAEVVTNSQPSTEKQNDNPTELIADFSNGVIGRDIEHAHESIFDLYYTQPVPEFGITLALSIWGNTTISYNLGFLYGGDSNMKYGYYLKTVNKAGWDKKSVDWFDSLLVKAFNDFIKTTSVIKHGIIPKDETSLEGGDSLTIFFNSSSLLNALTELKNNFLKYNGITQHENKPKIEIGQVYKTGTALYKIDELSTHTIWFYREEDGALLDTSRNAIERLINIGEWVLQTEETNEYENYTQEELKTLLITYTYLAEKGNEEAKKEIVILQTLIK